MGNIATMKNTDFEVGCLEATSFEASNFEISFEETNFEEADFETTNFEEIMLREAERFMVEIDEDGEQVFSWVDTQIEDLSSHKLEDIIRLSELPDCDLDPIFLDTVIVELLSRRSGFVC